MRTPLHLNLIFKTYRTVFFLTALLPVVSYGASNTLKIEADHLQQQANRHALIGTNVSLWTPEPLLFNTDLNAAMRNWKPALIRMPGGSWANEYYWNGNGVRLGNDHGLENFDSSKQNPDGSWKIDFSDYTPGFRVEGEERHLSDYHGHIDVKTQHDWIQKHDADALVTVNLGSGSPRLASEWVKWANQKEDYNVRYWELGNELSGDWELGHRLPDGSSMTGEIYTERYLKFAAAMRAVDPKLKLGGPASPGIELDFMEALIRDGGDAVDYLSFHAYPVGVSLRDTQKKFEAIETVREAILKIRKWIQTYQPNRQDEIEIGISEWNIKVNEDQDTADLISALWSAAFVGMLFEEGVDFANQWDLTTQVEAGGHSAFYHDTTQIIPKSQYWGLWMWGQLMGNELVHSKLKSNDHLKSFVTRSSEGIQIMCINTSENETARIKLQIQSTKKLNPSAQIHQFSSAHYFWDPHANQPRWSRPPSIQAILINKKSTLEIPPFSINVIQIPWRDIKTTPTSTVQTQQPQKEQQPAPSLKLLLPQRVPVDRPIEGWLIAQDQKTKKPILNLQDPVQISITGPAQINPQNLLLKNGSAPFTIQPMRAGQITIQARSDQLKTKHNIELVALRERSQLYLTFDNPIEDWNIRSSFEVSAEPSIRPNQDVAAAFLNRKTPARDNDILFHFEPLPRASFPFEKTASVTGKLQAAHNLKCNDPDARINLILQSDANHWMPIGSVKLSQIMGQWKDFDFRIKDPIHLDAVSKLYSIRFQIQSQAPITGEIYLDNLGFVFKTGL